MRLGQRAPKHHTNTWLCRVPCLPGSAFPPAAPHAFFPGTNALALAGSSPAAPRGEADRSSPFLQYLHYLAIQSRAWVWPGFSSTAHLSTPVTALMWGWHVPRDLSLLVLTPDALPDNQDCSRALARLCSHIYLAHLLTHLLTRMPKFPLETKWS